MAKSVESTAVCVKENMSFEAALVALLEDLSLVETKVSEVMTWFRFIHTNEVFRWRDLRLASPFRTIDRED